jgi:hypothetical protein
MALIEVTKLLACINITETYQQHFVNNGWASPQAQVSAGYDVVIEPAKTNGSYQEVFDFGVVLSNVIIVMNWNADFAVGSQGSIQVTSSTLEFSTDNATWTTPITGTSGFAGSMRYVRFTMNFVSISSPADKNLCYFSALTCSLNVKKEQDAGNGTANADDIDGTIFTFNKTFLSVDSIMVTPISTTACFPVVDFAGGINPTSFKVLVFDNAGVRITKQIQWLARGIVQ